MANPNGEYSAKEMRRAIRRSGGVVLKAADILGCDPSTVYRYADEYTTVQMTLEETRLNIAAQAEGYHARMMRDPEHPDHYKAVMDVLRNYHPDDWSDRKTEQEHSTDGFTVNIQPPDGND
jgi:hypothetical protein